VRISFSAWQTAIQAIEGKGIMIQKLRLASIVTAFCGLMIASLSG
jgi:hypothetical protein